MSLFNFFKKRNNKKGFMLLEMIVSVGLFSVVMTIGMVSLLNIVNANKRAQSFKIVANNLNLALESMSRDIRFGYDYEDVYGANSFTFTRPGGVNVTYSLSGGSVFKTVSGFPAASITAVDIVIENLSFYVKGAPVGDNLQPKVIIVINGYAGYESGEKTYFALQTSVSQRFISS